MRTLRSLMLGAALLSLGGCGAGSTVSIPNPFTGGTISAADVQSAAVAACGFLPTIQTVTGIISAVAGVGAAVSSAESVASQICSAVLPVKQAGKLGAARPKVHGVAVYGKFVR